MRGWVAVGIVLGMLVGAGGPAQAQPVTRPAGDETNLFATVDPPRAVDGVQVDVPVDWSVRAVRLLRYGTDPVAVQMRRPRPGRVLALAPRRVRGPLELVVQVRIPGPLGQRAWTVQSVIRHEGEEEEPPAAGAPRVRPIADQTYRVEVEAAPPTTADNRALSLAEAAAPVHIASEALPPFGPTASFTLEAWLRTTGLNEIVASTWNGDESETYPVELMVDRAGRLRAYTGRPGDHRALRSTAPVADGHWHHVAVVHVADRNRLRLVLNGTVVDSLRNYRLPRPSGPASLALGGRPQGPAAGPGGTGASFTGRMDEVRVWGAARSVTALRRARRTTTLRTDEGPQVRLGFEGDESSDDQAATDEEAGVDRWPAGARRVPSTLSFRPPLHQLRAESTDEAVTIRWAARAEAARAFVVERSPDGQTFESIAQLRPDQARQAPAEEGTRYAYTDASVTGEVVYYRVRLVPTDGAAGASSTIKVGRGAPAEARSRVRLAGNFPNPFTESTTIAYEVREPTAITLTVWTVAGTRVATLVDRRQGRGEYEVTFEATGLPSGPYFVRLITPDGTRTHRMMLLR